MANRDVTIKLTELGSDIENVSIYKSSFTEANYVASVSRTVLMGSGYTFSVDDQVSKFLLFSGEPCNATLELDLPSPTTTTTTASGTTTTTTSTTTTSTTTTTTTPAPGSVEFDVYFTDSITNASFDTASQKITALPGATNLTITAKTISAAPNYTNSSYSVSIGGTNASSISGPSSVTNSVNGFTISSMPNNGGNATITISGNATYSPPATTTTTTSTTTTTTTTSTTTTTTTTLAPASSTFYHANQNSLISMAGQSNPTSVTLWRAGGTSVGVGTQLYTSSTLSNTTKASSSVYGQWIGMESAGGPTTFNGIYNAGNNITAPSMSGGDTLVKISSTGVVTEIQSTLVYMGLYEGTSCADAFTATTSSGTSGHYISQGSFATGTVKNFGTGLSNGSYYARYVNSSLEVGQYVANSDGASNGYIQGVSSVYSCP